MTADPGRARDRTVLVSRNLPGETVCVDLFRRPDGSFGFECYRRDVETGEGWFAVGGHEARRFSSREAAEAAAGKAHPWFAEE